MILTPLAPIFVFSHIESLFRRDIHVCKQFRRVIDTTESVNLSKFLGVANTTIIYRKLTIDIIKLIANLALNSLLYTTEAFAMCQI